MSRSRFASILGAAFSLSPDIVVIVIFLAPIQSLSRNVHAPGLTVVNSPR